MAAILHGLLELLPEKEDGTFFLHATDFIPKFKELILGLAISCSLLASSSCGLPGQSSLEKLQVGKLLPGAGEVELDAFTTLAIWSLEQPSKGATSWELLSACLGSLLAFQKDNHVTFIGFGSLLPCPTPSEGFPLLLSSYTSLLGD